MLKNFIKSCFVATVILGSSIAQSTEVIFNYIPQFVSQQMTARGLNWAVGDENNYKLNMGGFINGTMKMYVREITPIEAWLVQDINLGFQKQKVEVLIDTNTGEVKKMLVNGQEQAPPKADFEIIEQKEASVTVPAGTFKTMYIKIKDNANNGQISEQWVNPREIPINGMAKSLADSQMGKVNIELTSFKKN